MPKNKKKQQIGLGHEPEEGRPPSLTLGCFIKYEKAKPKKLGSSSTVGQVQRQSEETNSTLDISKEEGKGSKEASTESTLEDFKLSDACGGGDVKATGPKIQENDAKIICRHLDDRTSPKEDGADENFKIMRTKKGGFPIYIEKRAKGKKVTVVKQVTGNQKLLLQKLKTKFGTGGLIKGNEVEIQGDFDSKLQKYLQENRSFMIPYNPNVKL